jgi:hypothetical protein
MASVSSSDATTRLNDYRPSDPRPRETVLWRPVEAEYTDNRQLAAGHAAREPRRPIKPSSTAPRSVPPDPPGRRVGHCHHQPVGKSPASGIRRDRQPCAAAVPPRHPLPCPQDADGPLRRARPPELGQQIDLAIHVGRSTRCSSSQSKITHTPSYRFDSGSSVQRAELPYSLLGSSPRFWPRSASSANDADPCR